MGLVDDARNMLRDHPQYFEVAFPAPLRSTLRLPAPLVHSVEVFDPSTGRDTSAWALDQRNGLLKLEDIDAYPQGVLVSGYHFEWFLDEDIDFHAGLVLSEHLNDGRVGLSAYNDLGEAEQRVVAMGAVYYSLWSLMTQFATEIDTSTPEGMFVPAHQRFQQVQQMAQYWKAQYDTNAGMLNVGLSRISQSTLRRTSRLTNRLVPVFERQEIDDPRPPVRSFPKIEPNVPSSDTNIDGDLAVSEYGIGGGWESLGTSGA